MPITLSQLSRRDFLRRTLLAGAVVSFAPATHAGLFGKSRDKDTFFFLSDTHVASDPSMVKGRVNMADNLAACLREVAAWSVKPGAIFVTGDLALSDGQSGDYATFGRLLNPVRTLAPVHLVLGNHDHRDRFWQGMPEDVLREKSVPARQCAVIESARANWFLLDSLDATSSTPGELGSSQLKWLEAGLIARGRRPAIIVAHHNLNEVNGIAGLKDSVELERIFSIHRHVKAFIFGHTHAWDVSLHQSGVHLINLPPTAYRFGANRPNGWVRISLDRKGMELELRALDKSHAEHAKVKRVEWRA